MRRTLAHGLPRAIASDLDGTLLRSDGSLSPRTRAALTAVRRAGIETVFVTGRPPRWVDHLAADVGEHGLVLCGNGAFLYDVAQARTLHTTGLDPADVAGIVADVRAALPGAAFAAELGMSVRVEPAFLAAAGRGVGAVAGRHERIGAVDRVPVPIGKLLVRVPARDVAAPVPGGGPGAFAVVARAVGERGEVVSSGAPHLVEIGPPGVTKASALARFCAERRIRPQHVWAFGDELNDVAMLAWAGRGFAVGTAHPRVLEVASDVAAGPMEDGVAVVLEQLLLRPRE